MRGSTSSYPKIGNPSNGNQSGRATVASFLGLFGDLVGSEGGLWVAELFDDAFGEAFEEDLAYAGVLHADGLVWHWLWGRSWRRGEVLETIMSAESAGRSS